MLERSKNYVQNAELALMMNYDEFVPSKYGEEKFKKRSKLLLR